MTLSSNITIEYKERIEQLKMLINKAKGYNTFNMFFDTIGIDPVYMSKLFKGEVINFPSPALLRKIAFASNGKVTYEELMQVCGRNLRSNQYNNNRIIRRGDIYYVDLGNNVGSIQSGIRPCVVVGNPKGILHSSIVSIAPITSRNKSKLPTHITIGQECGLDRESTILCEQIRTISKEQLGDYVGSVVYVDGLYEKIDKALKIAMGVWSIEDELLEKVEKIQDEEATIFQKILNKLMEKYKNKELVYVR